MKILRRLRRPEPEAPLGIRLVDHHGSHQVALLPEPEWDQREGVWRWSGVLLEHYVTDDPKAYLHVDMLPAHTTVQLTLYVALEVEDEL